MFPISFLSFSVQSFGLMLPSSFPSRALSLSRAEVLREAPHTSLSAPLFLLLSSSEKYKALGMLWLFQVSLEKAEQT